MKEIILCREEMEQGLPAAAGVEAEVRAAEAEVKWAGRLPQDLAVIVCAQTAARKQPTLQASPAHSRCARSVEQE